MSLEDSILGILVLDNVDVDVVVMRANCQLIILRTICHALDPLLGIFHFENYGI